jgi:hypothetical protein
MPDIQSRYKSVFGLLAGEMNLTNGYIELNPDSKNIFKNKPDNHPSSFKILSSLTNKNKDNNSNSNHRFFECKWMKWPTS